MNVAFYGRKSNDEQDKNVKSIEVQKSVVTRFAASRGWTIVANYVDDGITGAIYDRPGLSQLLAAVSEKGRGFDAVVVSALDRVGRGKSAETIAVLDTFEQAGVQVWCADDGSEATNVEDETGMKEIWRTFKLVGARVERSKTIKRVRDAARERFDKGFVVAGRTFGYRAERLPGVKANARMVIDDAQAAVVRRVFREVAEGKGYVRIAKGLNADLQAGLVTPGPQRISDAKVEALQREGKPVPVNFYSATGVREIIFRDLYVGRQPYGQIRRTGPKSRVRVPREQWSWRDVPELAIVTQEEWDAAHKRLAATTSSFLRAKNKLIGHPEVTKGKTLLSGFLVCGAPALSPRAHGGAICGEALIATRRGRHEEEVYVCRAVKNGKGDDYCANHSAVPRQELHDAVIASLRKTFSAESFRAHQQRVAQDTEARRRRESKREVLTAELPKLQAKAARLAKMVAEVEDTGDLLAEYTKAKKAVQTAKDDLAALDGQERDEALAAADAAKLEATWSDWIAQAERDTEAARQLLRKVLASSIAVRPTGQGTWAFAGFSRYDEAIKGGIGVDKRSSAVLSELVDSETAEKMMDELNKALVGSISDLVPAGVKVRFILREDPTLPPIAGGSDSDDSHGYGGSQVETPEMAPKPPNLRSAPAEPWRSSIALFRPSRPRRRGRGRARTPAARCARDRRGSGSRARAPGACAETPADDHIARGAARLPRGRRS